MCARVREPPVRPTVREPSRLACRIEAQTKPDSPRSGDQRRPSPDFRCQRRPGTECQSVDAASMTSPSVGRGSAHVEHAHAVGASLSVLYPRTPLFALSR
jgi:hypothetical protein